MINFFYFTNQLVFHQKITNFLQINQQTSLQFWNENTLNSIFWKCVLLFKVRGENVVEVFVMMHLK